VIIEDQAQRHVGGMPKLPRCPPGSLHATNECAPLTGGEAQDRAICVFGVTDPKATFGQRRDFHAVISLAAGIRGLLQVKLPIFLAPELGYELH
jgi:hypothetical protein